MKFAIKFEGQNLTIEADDAVQALISIIDAGISVPEDAEFKVCIMKNAREGKAA